MIIHLDADAFYVSVEQAENPELRGKAVAVGGEKRGIIASASYEARRRGVYTPMPSAKARQVCPELIMVRGDMAKYGAVSRRMFGLVEEFTPYIERTSIDEGYFDVSGHRTLTPRQIAEQLKARIGEQLQITVSLGIAANKLVSQIAAKLKKPDALVEVPIGTEREFLAPLESYWLPGIGKKMSERMRAFGLNFVADVATAPPDLLREAAGSYAETLRAYAMGIDDRPLSLEEGDAKSYGVQDTFDENVRDRATVVIILRTMADRLMARVREDQKAIRTVTVKVRYPDFTDESHATTLDQPTTLETDLYPLLPRLLRGAWKKDASIRLVALRVSHICEPVVQGELLLDVQSKRRSKQHEAAKLLDALREKSLPLTRGYRLREPPRG